MTLVDNVKTIAVRLMRADSGWETVLRNQGWNFGADPIDAMSPGDLADKLVDLTLNIDRDRIGFEDFASQASRMISPGEPGKSLLYHALASPLVHPTGTSTPAANPAAYPTMEDLDEIENFIYSLVADRTDLQETVVAVFAYQYRTASRTSHRVHADLAFSRTGVARVGTASDHYDGARRSFWVIPKTGGDAIAVMPARYAAFLARKAKPPGVGSVQGGHNGLVDDDYFFPVHKLFDGDECLAGRSISVRFEEYHRNEKLKRVHELAASGALPMVAGFDIDAPPFVRDSENSNDLVSLRREGASVLVVPVRHPELVRTANQRNANTQREEIVRFRVPALTRIRRPGSQFPRPTRFTKSTLEIPAFGNDRLAPEYVNIRHQVDPDGSLAQEPTDLNDLSTAAFDQKMNDGGYFAAHYVDDSCDGCVVARVNGISQSGEDRAAFSLVTAPDFFPLADQIELLDAQAQIDNVRPLSMGRLPASSRLRLPNAPGLPAFPQRDTTITAVVGALAVGSPQPAFGKLNRMTSFLPDGASDVFAPGWDVSRTRDGQGINLTSLGLGSPFPEDAKLCAALSSFWPAVTPDASRTFGNQSFPNQIPMLDGELGFHPNHPRVVSGEVPSFRGWDGEYGPFFEQRGGVSRVNFADIERSDYVTNALEHRMRVSLTAEVQSEDLLLRAIALQVCQQVFQLTGANPDSLVVAEHIDDWQNSNPGDPRLQGNGFLYMFADLGAESENGDDLSRRSRLVDAVYTCQFGRTGIAFQRDTEPPQFFPFQ